MKRSTLPLLTLIGLIVALVQPVHADMLPPSPDPAPAADEPLAAPHDELSPEAEQAMWDAIQQHMAMLQEGGALVTPSATQAVTYIFPLRLAAGQPDYAGFRVSAFSD